MHPISLQDDVALVTGASRGIGAAIAHGLARAGADVALAARDLDALADVQRTIQQDTGKQVHVVQLEVTDRESVDAMTADVIERFGRIDALVNSAGILRLESFEDVTEASFNSILDVNLLGAFRTIQSVSPHMREREYGRIVNVSSIAGLRGRALEAHYAASKGGLNQLTKSLAIELARFGITVNAVCPGYIRTPMNEHLMVDDATRAGMEKRVPQRRIGTTDEVAAPVVFLASRSSSYVTGTTLSVDGGSAAR